MTEPDDERSSLNEALDEIASAARPVDLTAGVSRKARAMRRRRAAASGVAVVAVIGIGGYAAGHLGSRDVVTESPGAGITVAASATPSASVSPSTATVPASPSAVASSAAAPVSPSAAPDPSTSPGARSTSPTAPPELTTLPPLTTPPTPGHVTTSAATPPVTTTTGHPAAPTTPATTPTTSTTAATTQPPAAPEPCKTFDDFAPGAGGNLTVTAQMKARAIAMGTALCAWAGGGKTYEIEEWVSIGGLSTGYVGLTYNIQAHIIGGSAGPIPAGEYWIAVTHGAASGATFPDGTQVHYETSVPAAIKAKVEAPGSPFDAFP
ncbi:MAG: hypothetical protein QOE76_1113 [Frankiales bacterium]|nr:hypothetical protein [Frankiales bacterium]